MPKKLNILDYLYRASFVKFVADCGDRRKYLIEINPRDRITIVEIVNGRWTRFYQLVFWWPIDMLLVYRQVDHGEMADPIHDPMEAIENHEEVNKFLDQVVTCLQR